MKARRRHSRTKGAKYQIPFGRGLAWFAVKAIITEGTVADCTKAIDLINGFAANHLLANRA